MEISELGKVYSFNPGHWFYNLVMGFIFGKNTFCGIDGVVEKKKMLRTNDKSSFFGRIEQKLGCSRRMNKQNEQKPKAPIFSFS